MHAAQKRCMHCATSRASLITPARHVSVTERELQQNLICRAMNAANNGASAARRAQQLTQAHCTASVLLEVPQVERDPPAVQEAASYHLTHVVNPLVAAQTPDSRYSAGDRFT